MKTVDKIIVRIYTIKIKGNPMLTRHEMVILKRAQKKLMDFADIATKQKNFQQAKMLEDESAVLYKVIAIFENK